MSTTTCTIEKVSNGFIVKSEKISLVVEGDEKKLIEFITKSLESPMRDLLKKGDVKLFVDIKPLTV